MFDNLLEMGDICFRTISMFVLRRNSWTGQPCTQWAVCNRACRRKAAGTGRSCVIEIVAEYVRVIDKYSKC